MDKNVLLNYEESYYTHEVDFANPQKSPAVDHPFRCTNHDFLTGAIRAAVSSEKADINLTVQRCAETLLNIAEQSAELKDQVT